MESGYDVQNMGPQLGQTQEQAEKASQRIKEGAKKGGEARKAQMSHEDYVEMGRKGGSVRADQASEGAMFAGHPEGALRRDLPKGRPFDDQYVNPMNVVDDVAPHEVEQEIRRAQTH